MADTAKVVDPFLKHESITSDTLTFGRVALPILSGVQPGGIGLDGKHHDFDVRIVHVSRERVDEMLSAAEQ